MTLVSKQIVLLLTPVLLLASTYFWFRKAVAVFGFKSGYFLGFVGYWFLCCFLLPLWLLGAKGLVTLFHDVPLRLGQPFWLGILCLFLPLALGYGYAFPRALRNTTLIIVVVSLALALVNAISEELLWRGAYVTLFPDNLWLGLVYPASGFALWHLAPQAVFPNTAPGGRASFVLVAFALGLMWGWVAISTGSILWTSVVHVLFDFSGLGGRIYFRES